jgi:hypothetical protein
MPPIGQPRRNSIAPAVDPDYTQTNAMWIFKVSLMSLATVGCVAAQNPPGAFQHLPPTPSPGWMAPMPTKMKLAPRQPGVVVSRDVQPTPCAIPLLRATPDAGIHYTIRTITPPRDQADAMAYVAAAPTCGDAVK